MRAQDRDDWQGARAAFIAAFEDEDPDVAYIRRCTAALRMYEIEREYRPDLPPAADVLARIADNT
jgi:hypothetical protein